MGVGIDDMAVTQQVHKADVRIVTSADKHVCMSHVPYEADGIVTLSAAADNVHGGRLRALCCSMTGSTRRQGDPLRLAQLRRGHPQERA